MKAKDLASTLVAVIGVHLVVTNTAGLLGALVPLLAAPPMAEASAQLGLTWHAWVLAAVVPVIVGLGLVAFRERIGGWLAPSSPDDAAVALPDLAPIAVALLGIYFVIVGLAWSVEGAWAMATGIEQRYGSWRVALRDAPTGGLVYLVAGTALLVGRRRIVSWWRSARPLASESRAT